MAVAQPAISAQNQSMWLFNPILDTLGLGGLTFLVLLAFLLTGILTLSPSQFGWTHAAVFTIGALINFPHYAATYYRVYRQKSKIQQYSLEAVWTPIGLALLTVPCFFQPTLAPWYAFLYYLLSGYHYSGQTYGISRILMGKSGLRLTSWQKQLFVFPIYATYLFTLVCRNVEGASPIQFFEIHIPVLGLPHWSFTTALALVTLSFLLYIALNIRLYRDHQQWMPPLIQVVVGAHLLWFTVGNLYPTFYLFVPALHCLQYLMITTYCDYKERSHSATHPTTEATLGFLAYFKSRAFLQYYVWLVSVGFSLFILLPLVCQFSGLSTFGFASILVVSFLNLHHFILDGAIWKLRKPEVAKPLLAN